MKLIKNLFLTLVLAFVSVAVVAQPVEPVFWKTSVEEQGEGVYKITFKASIEQGWHLYDMGPYEVGGPMATAFTFEPASDYALEGDMTAEGELIKHFDDVYEMEVGYYEGSVAFSQLVKSAEGAVVKVAAEWMSCNDQNCVNSDKDFEITVGAPKAAADDSAKVVDAVAATSGGSLWSFVLSAIGWALIALLTPCVFPMIPMTVSFFLKGSGSVAKGRFRALMYGLFIVVLYTVPIGIIIFLTWLIGGDAVTADIFNWLATHWLPNLIFFVVFMVFAASFFGAFEITLPSALVNKSDAQSDKGGIGGIFFMALTLVLVSFSCTGPIVGSVLIKSTSGEVWSPIITMLAFSTAFALPFTIFAFFPSMLKKLPKSGGWLNSVKVVLGFVEVALGFKFLSVADQVYHWNLLDREIYLAIWIVVFSLLGLYLLGKIKFAHDSELKHLSVGRLALAIGVFTFVVYMIPGMWGAPLKGLSGYLPPLSSQDFVIGQGAATTSSATSGEADINAPKYGEFLHLPHGLKGFFDLKEAEAYAAKVGKPIFIDFTGHGCVNCREMEARVWADPAVQQILRDEYVIVALYTDDKMQLPESDWVTTENGKVLKSLGKVNANYALTRFGVNAQPYYVLQGKGGEVLGEPRGYDLSVEGFVKFLKKGVEEYKK